MALVHKTFNILIADDDGTTCRALRLLLLEHGHQVVAEAHNGEIAVELCTAHKPDIAFLDIDMPVMNGHQAAEKIRELVPEVGIIMISSVPTMKNVQHALQAGASAFVVKPFNAVKVVEAIDQCVKHKR